MRKLFNWLFGWMGWNAYYHGVAIEGKSEIFYLAPKSVWRRVENLLDVSVSRYAFSEHDKESRTDMSWYFFCSFSSLDGRSESQLEEESEILRVDKIIDSAGQVSFLFFSIKKIVLR